MRGDFMGLKNLEIRWKSPNDSYVSANLLVSVSYMKHLGGGGSMDSAIRRDGLLSEDLKFHGSLKCC